MELNELSVICITGLIPLKPLSQSHLWGPLINKWISCSWKSHCLVCLFLFLFLRSWCPKLMRPRFPTISTYKGSSNSLCCACTVEWLLTVQLNDFPVCSFPTCPPCTLHWAPLYFTKRQNVQSPASTGLWNLFKNMPLNSTKCICFFPS